MLFSWFRTRSRRRAEIEAAKGIDPSDAEALAKQPVTALDGLSKSIVVNVDNAVRTSEAELALAVEEFGTESTAPFQQAVDSAKRHWPKHSRCASSSMTRSRKHRWNSGGC